jgi:hypothetical protein
MKMNIQLNDLNYCVVVSALNSGDIHTALTLNEITPFFLLENGR